MTCRRGPTRVLCAVQSAARFVPLDGGRALYLLLAVAGRAGNGGVGLPVRWGFATALAAASGTVWLMWRTGGSIWLLPAAARASDCGVGKRCGMAGTGLKFVTFP